MQNSDIYNCYLLTTQPLIADVGLVHKTPRKFENGVFTLKTYLMFFVHTTAEELKNAAILTGHFEFVFEKYSRRVISDDDCYVAVNV